ncbi:fumarylacetoacetate hydrolase family protein [Cohnella mopanensis]|uniref:fumarylacetoacetate hydrolase family protein n=1 Tax=Cohnella mopanensis TaxID=2911966 RepID=UPI001EF8142F|nr:fumarylacetoacetate hydrolase family protein [Cohnella mopanensis]
MNNHDQLSFSNLRNIYCVGRNYRLHAAELGNEVPASPMIFTKPTHAATDMSEGIIAIPGSQGSIHYEAELVFAVGKPYEPGISCDEIITSFTVGLDFTLRDVQDQLKAKGQPWLAAKGFRNSATLGRWLNYPGLKAMAENDFGLRLNGKEVQRGNVRDMVFNLQQIVDFVGRNYGLGTGDILFTGTPEGVGELNDGDKLDVWWNETSLGVAMTKFEG